MRLARQQIVQLDKRHVWHPWTRMKQYIEDTEPVVIESAQGSRLYDVDGRSYIDSNSSWWVAALGHNHPRLTQALVRQASTLAHTSLAGVAHEPAARLGELLCQAAPPGLEKVFYSDNGSTSVEVALKMAFQFWQNEGCPHKKRFISLNQAFHGETLGAESLSGIDLFKQAHASLLMDCLYVPVPADEASCAAAVKALADTLSEHSGEIAAFILEPRVQGGAGMHIYPAAYLRQARQLCNQHDVLLIADEVFTGYGRTGSMWACEGAGISPDILCLSKGFTGGMLPMAATLTTQRIFDAFLGGIDRAFLHGHSFCGNPLGAAVAAEVLRVFRDEKILERAEPKADRIAEGFERIAQIPGVSGMRTLGMVGAVNLAAEPSYLGETGWRAAAIALARGVLLRPLGDIVYITPPLTIPDADLEELLDVIHTSIRAAWGRSNSASA